MFRIACAIPEDDTVIITGGFYRDGADNPAVLNTVSVYNVEGWQEDLPPLNTGRCDHACSSFWSEGRKVK